MCRIVVFCPVLLLSPAMCFYWRLGEKSGKDLV